ncbi:MAG: hypothetical protein RIE73_33715 [Coleofasciculus sp. C1-SOL-03]
MARLYFPYSCACTKRHDLSLVGEFPRQVWVNCTGDEYRYRGSQNFL